MKKLVSLFRLTLKLTLDPGCLWECLLFVKLTDQIDSVWQAFYCPWGFLLHLKVFFSPNLKLLFCLRMFSLFFIWSRFLAKEVFFFFHWPHVIFVVQVCISSPSQQLRMSSVVQEQMCLVESPQRKWTNTHTMTSPSPPHRLCCLTRV